jgi:hypothetical protein
LSPPRPPRQSPFQASRLGCRRGAGPLGGDRPMCHRHVWQSEGTAVLAGIGKAAQALSPAWSAARLDSAPPDPLSPFQETQSEPPGELAPDLRIPAQQSWEGPLFSARDCGRRRMAAHPPRGLSGSPKLPSPACLH